MQLKFHHVGLAGRNVEEEKVAHELLGYVAEGAMFHDPVQHVRGLFMVQGGMRIELLEPASSDSPLEPFLRRGVKLYHQAFEIDDIDAAILELTRAGAILRTPPTPAVAFAGRPISFLMLRTLLLIELIQASRA